MYISLWYRREEGAKNSHYLDEEGKRSLRDLVRWVKLEKVG